MASPVASSRSTFALPSASGPLSLKRNASWSFVGTTIYAVSNWGMLSVLAKLGTREMVGEFALGLAIAQPVMMLAQLHLRAVQVTDRRGEFTFNDYLNLRVISVVGAVVVVSAIAAGSGAKAETALVIIATA